MKSILSKYSSLLLILSLFVACDISSAGNDPKQESSHSDSPLAVKNSDTTHFTAKVSTVENPQSVLFIFSHPDDELYSIGTIRYLVENNFHVEAVFVTSGKYGRDIRGVITTPDELGPARELESINAFTEIGVPDTCLTFLRLDDSSTDITKIKEKSIDLLKNKTPDYLVTFGPDGVYGHLDHRITSAAVTEASVVGSLAKLPKLYHIAVSTARNNGSNGEILNSSTNQAIHDSAINLRIDTKPYLYWMLKAASQYKTQFDYTFLSSILTNTTDNYGYEDYITVHVKGDR